MGFISRKFVYVGYSLVLIILVANGVLTYVNVRTIRDSDRAVFFSREFLGELSAAMRLLVDAETGQRGYLLTGEDEYLVPYRHAAAEINAPFDRLLGMAEKSSAQEARIVELKRLADVKMGELRQTVDLMETGNAANALVIIRTGLGHRIMSEARELAARIAAEEDLRLGLLTEASSMAARRTVASFVSGTALTLLLLLSVAQIKRREEAEARRAAEEIRQSEAWFRTTLDGIGDAVIATDSAGRVRLLNPISEALTGWTRAEAEGRPVAEIFRIVNETTRAPVESPIDRVLAQGLIVGLANHTILIARDGAETPIEDSAAPIKDDRGQIVGVVLVFRDASEKRRHEIEREELLAVEQEARAEAQEANRAKDQFLSVLSHELRTPLNPILLAVSSMLERTPPAEEVPPTLEMIRQNVNLQARLIDDLLDVMRIVQGKLPLHWGVVGVHDLIHRAVEICRSDLYSKNIRLDLDLSAGRHHVNADAARLQQVYWNLIKNAVKFTPQGGSLAISSRNVDDGDDRASRLVVEFRDDGIGIEPEAMARIFDPFQQAETSITRRFGGLGLGLAIGRGIVEAHGGLLSAESAGKDRGTTFRIELRTMDAPELEKVEPAEGRTNGRSLDRPQPQTILLVEDEPATIRLMARLLRSLGHEVTTAGTIRDALEIVAGREFSLVISDIGLPDGSGLELMKNVSARGPVKAIALTGYGMEEDIRRSREAGFSVHMTKPIDFTKLEAMIRQILA